jgi:hypothetical protein
MECNYNIKQHLQMVKEICPSWDNLSQSWSLDKKVVTFLPQYWNLVLVVQVPTFFFLLQKVRLPIGKQYQGKSFVI